MSGPAPWTAAGNDYRGIMDRNPGPWPDMGVVIVGGEGLDVTRKAVEDQSYPGRLQIADVSADLADTAEATQGCQVVALLSSGQVPGPDWAARHAEWHRRAANLVVLGGTEPDQSGRKIRGSRLLLAGDEGFSAMRDSNVSLGRDDWLRHPRLDLISGWGLWNDGRFFVYEPAAKLTDGRPDLSSGDEAIVLEDSVPHRVFRPVPSALHGTPKVSWLVGVETAEEAAGIWAMCRTSSFPDQEIVLYGSPSATAVLKGVSVSNPRVAVISDGTDLFRAAVTATRGELVAIADPRVALSPETVSKTVSRFESKPSAPVVRVGYRVDGDRYLRLDDLAAIDSSLGRDGLPVFAVATRRELMKEQALLADPGAAWTAVLERSETSLVISPVVEVPGSSPIEPGTPGLAELSSVGLAEATREVVRRVRRARSDETRPADRESVDDKLTVAYVGFTGHDNLGDEAVKVAIERLMPWGRFEADPVDPKLLMVGGGTLLNGRRYYLTRMLRQESAVVERALFGTGVRSPDYWGVTEPMEDWFSFIDSCLFAAVRGPDSVKNLRALGYGRDLPVIGDPALFLEPPPDMDSAADGRVVVCPVYTGGNLHGGSDEPVFDALAGVIARLRSEGREVVMLSAFPQDDRWLIDLMRRSGSPDLPYLAGYADIDDTMGLLASAELVIGERLHAAIMAAAAGTPFVGLEYRPKVRDFARSVGQEDAVVRTDEMERLDEVVDRVLGHREDITGDIAAHVVRYRALQRQAAAEIHGRLLDR